MPQSWDNPNVKIDEGAHVARSAIFEPVDVTGSAQPIVIGRNCRIAPSAVIYGGVVLGEGVVVEEHSVVGSRSFGYAMGSHYGGHADTCTVGAGPIIRAGAHVYSDVVLGDQIHIEHHTLVRSAVRLGAGAQLAHFVSVKRGSQLGNNVRSSPHTHITGGTVAEDRVFFGAGVKTVSSKNRLFTVTPNSVETSGYIDVTYTHRTLVSQHGHQLFIDFATAKGLRLDFTYTPECDIRHVNVLPYIASPTQPRGERSPHGITNPSISLDFGDAWTFPRSGVVFTWLLNRELVPPATS